MAIAEGTGTIDGAAIGAASRRAAARAGMPVSYYVLTQELGWYWAAALEGATPHLVPPYGERARCGHALTRADRQPVTRGIAERACDRCWKNALGDTPRRSS